jgi:multiple sugar transport system substrate-binding protein
MNKKFFALILAAALLIALFAPVRSTNVKAQDPATVTWFVGLGSGGQPEQITAQEAVVEQFNSTHDDIQIELQLVDYDVSADTLSTLIASGDPPDIVGPVGIGGSNNFAGSFLDLQPLIDATGYDLSRWDPALVDFYRVEGEGLLGLPFGVYPSFIFYNRTLFDEAGLDYPPMAYGEDYADGEPWDAEKLKELGLLLTVDAEGNDATMEGFDPENIVQFGFAPQWYGDDFRSMVTAPFGAGSFYDAETGEAVIPENWSEGAHWYYDAMWSSHFMPNYTYQQSDMMLTGNVFSSDHLGMAVSHMWFVPVVAEYDIDWGIAPMPSYNGTVTTKLHADTFRIMKDSDNPEAAFEVLSYLLSADAAPQLLDVYGSMPADQALAESYMASLAEQFPDVNWQIAVDSLSYPDNPSHEGWMPNFPAADQRVKAFQALIQTTPDLDIDAELETLRTELQAIFEGAAE